MTLVDRRRPMAYTFLHALEAVAGSPAAATKRGPPRTVLDSRFRGNAVEDLLPRVWGCPPIPLFSPKSGGQGVEKGLDEGLAGMFKILNYSLLMKELT